MQEKPFKIIALPGAGGCASAALSRTFAKHFLRHHSNATLKGFDVPLAPIEVAD